MPKDALKRSSRYLPALDGIRALAVLWVIAYHFISIAMRVGNAPRDNFIMQWMQDSSAAGWIGVPVFFTLSGYLITGILYDSRNDAHYFRTFYARRTLRIFPLYYGVLLFLVILTPILHLHWGKYPWAYPLYLQGTVPADYTLSPHINIFHFWTLAVEEQFYLLWPMVCYFVRSLRKLLALALALSVCSLLFRIYLVVSHHGSSGVLRVYLPSQLDALTLGAAAALLLRSRYARTVLRLGPALFVAACIPLVAQTIRTQHPLRFEGGYLTFTLGQTCMALASAGLILWATPAHTLATRIFSIEPLRVIGRYSYGMYVLNPFFMDWTVPIRDYLYRAGIPYTVSTLLAALSMALVTFALAALSFRLYEERFLRLKRYFLYKQPPHTQSPALDDPVSRPTPG